MGIFSSRRTRRRTDSFASRVPALRWLGPGLSLGCIIFGVFYALSGRVSLKSFDILGADEVLTAAPVTLEDRPFQAADTIRVATFNIRTFGQKKSSTRETPETGFDVMGTIAKITSSFDLVAIQEVRGSDGIAIRRLIDLINANGGQHTATLSEPIGDENYTECYAFVWDQRRIRMIQNSAYVVHDEAGLMYREPMVASFETRLTPGDVRQPFRFTVINAHTDPDMVSPRDIINEINVLDDVFNSVRQYEYETAGEEDFLLVGDLNVATDQLQEIAMIPNMVSLAGNTVTNTRRNATYDHILLDERTTREYTGQSGVMDLQNQFGLTLDQALMVSDHMPVWAEFSAVEAPAVTATANNAGARMIR